MKRVIHLCYTIKINENKYIVNPKVKFHIKYKNTKNIDYKFKYDGCPWTAQLTEDIEWCKNKSKKTIEETIKKIKELIEIKENFNVNFFEMIGLDNKAKYMDS